MEIPKRSLFAKFERKRLPREAYIFHMNNLLDTLLFNVYEFLPLPYPSLQLTPQLLDLLEDLGKGSKKDIHSTLFQRRGGMTVEVMLEIVMRAFQLHEQGCPARGTPAWNSIVLIPTEEEWCAREAQRRTEHRMASEQAFMRCEALAPIFATLSVDEMWYWYDKKPDGERWMALTSKVAPEILTAVYDKADKRAITS